FGSASVVGQTIVHTFTILNTGAGTLNITGVSISGVTGGNFTASPAASSTVAPSGSTTFTVTFDPAAVGLSSATVNVASDDADENPYDFKIQGTGEAPPTSLVVNTTADTDDGFCSTDPGGCTLREAIN